MKAPDFSYFEAQNIEDAIKYKSEDDEAIILAGGQSLLPALNMRLSSPSCLIDISKINNLNEIKIESDFINIGAELHSKQPNLWIDLINQVEPGDIAILVYTSGTTGPPKGAMISNQNILYKRLLILYSCPQQIQKSHYFQNLLMS